MVNVGIFSLDAALSHTEPRTEDLKTENQDAILSPVYCDLRHLFHPYSNPQACYRSKLWYPLYNHSIHL